MFIIKSSSGHRRLGWLAPLASVDARLLRGLAPHFPLAQLLGQISEAIFHKVDKRDGVTGRRAPPSLARETDSMHVAGLLQHNRILKHQVHA